MSKDASGQVDPKKTNGEKRVKRGRLHFTEEEVAVKSVPAAIRKRLRA